MSTSKTYQQSLAEAGSETRPPMLERGSYIPWASRFKRFLNRKRENRKWLLKALEDGPYVFRNITPTGSMLPRLQEVEDLQGDDLLYYDAEMELTNMILLSIPNEIYNSVDSCKTTKEMWDRVERLMRGTIQNQVDRETRFTNEFDQFVAEPGESLVSVYNRFGQLMNNLERNNMKFLTVSVNTKFLNSLQLEWLKYTTQVCLAKKLTVDSFDDLFDYLSQFEKLVNTSRAKKLEKSHDPLALVAHTGSSSRNTSSYYVTHPSSVVDYDEENQAVVQGDRVNIQSRNSCYNCGGKGHYARNCPKPRVRDSKYFMEQMLLAKQDEAGVILTDEQNDFLFADASRMEEIEELSANICLMARIQPADQNSDDEPSYESAFIWKCRSIFIASMRIDEKYIIRDLEKQRDELSQEVKHFKQKNKELQQSHLILKRKMSENEDKYHDTILDLEEKLKKNVDMFLKIGNSLQAMFMLGPKPLSVYDQQLKHGLGYPNPYTLRQAISECPKLYVASRTDKYRNFLVNVRDSEKL
ncbi:integrase, catalytic region, zinc finger, CCHC-type containing protein [Tanacetum coccineum]